MKEEWRDIQGYEGLYQVSNLGRVKSLSRHIKRADGRTQSRKETILSSNVEKGYVMVWLSKNNKPTGYRVHRLVANAFIPNPENKPVINHIDGCKNNNCVNNLEWCTQKENIAHAFKTCLIIPEKVGRKSKFTKEEIEIIKTQYIPYDTEYGVRGLARRYGVSKSTMSALIESENLNYNNLSKKKYRSKLSDEQIEEIKQSFISRNKEYHYRALAKKYGVSKNTIWRIINSDSYKKDG